MHWRVSSKPSTAASPALDKISFGQKAGPPRLVWIQNLIRQHCHARIPGPDQCANHLAARKDGTQYGSVKRHLSGVHRWSVSQALAAGGWF